MSGMSLVGNVGGMLGLFIGFSFLGLSEWVVDSLVRAMARMLGEKPKNHKNRTRKMKPRCQINTKRTKFETKR